MEPEQGKGSVPTGMPGLAMRYGMSEPKEARQHSRRACPSTVSEAERAGEGLYMGGEGDPMQVSEPGQGEGGIHGGNADQPRGLEPK